MNDDGVDYQHMTAQLSNYVNMINRFNDIDQCMNFIKKSIQRTSCPDRLVQLMEMGALPFARIGNNRS